ncbi:LOW QUALITY PROTEIN: hypothetical protein YC2023_041360 [Brassica napus]
MIVAVREADLDDGMRETIVMRFEQSGEAEWNHNSSSKKLKHAQRDVAIALDEIKLVSSAELKLVTSVAIFSSERMRRRARAEKASL